MNTNSTVVESPVQDVSELRASFEQVAAHLNHVLKGKPEVVEMELVCLLAQGHLLLEDKPGLGKTILAKALAGAIGGQFSRVQCTPDLLPGDITGFSIYNQRAHEFEFRQGPVFADVLLADEINRATPRTQSALLEAMAERQVTVDAERYPLSSQFFVIATQNPIDQHGTYPLPEAQLDRFAMKLSVGYPARADELRLLESAVSDEQSYDIETRTFLPEHSLRLAQQAVSRTYVDPCIQNYLLDLGDATRRHPQIHLGVSPRGLLIWQRVCQAKAFLTSRDFVTPDDVQSTAQAVLGVRLGMEHGDSTAVVAELLDSIPVPQGFKGDRI
ncbi:AAA family ATPase [Thalassoglobus polymorphus]|uniref:ATPase family associated with various cellular activities (AAA) n=1 Tax=Thalassoglobus polymorphus TaxID=2527994 RepID=A0A517QUT1_9PLAN|nr:AAA family ATPase [Thalassoglobus polymorphus]QDT35390.1 ATPase family associated with various cellular activities (AAA) [Thalassoglobus polymorphus]